MTPADLVVTGRIASLAGDRGFGWVEAIAISRGRVVGSGRLVDVEPMAGPRTRRLRLAPDEVALPGLTDAHLHLVSAALAAGEVDLADAPDPATGLARIAAAGRARTDPDAWIRGAGWDVDRWGGWPTAEDLERVVPGRLVAIWAHDHHALWASARALARAGIDRGTADPAGGRIRRDGAGNPEGCLLENAVRLVAAHLPAPSAEAVATAVESFVPSLLVLGITAVHDPGSLEPAPGYPTSLVAYGALADAGRLGIRVHASIRAESLAAVHERGLRSGADLGADRDGRARLGWLKLFADGTLGSRTAALLVPMEPAAGVDPAHAERGVFLTPPGRLRELATQAAEGGIATQIHAIGDHAVRAGLDALVPTAGRVPLVPRLEHVQLLEPADLPRFAAAGVAASVQPIHLRADAGPAREAWGERAEAIGYPLARLVQSGALLPLGTDAPVEPPDPWPGIELAVTRVSPAWGEGARPFGPREALSLDRALRAACVDGAASAREDGRGRLTVGQDADLVVIPAACLSEPVEPGGPLGRTRPRRVLVGGAEVLG